MHRALPLLLAALTACGGGTSPLRSLPFSPADTPGGPSGKHDAQARNPFGVTIPIRILRAAEAQALEIGCPFGFTTIEMHKRWEPYKVLFPNCTKVIEIWKQPPTVPTAIWTCYFAVTGTSKKPSLIASNPSPRTHCHVKEGIGVY